jgi:hypothetical protein
MSRRLFLLFLYNPLALSALRPFPFRSFPPSHIHWTCGAGSRRSTSLPSDVRRRTRGSTFHLRNRFLENAGPKGLISETLRPCPWSGSNPTLPVQLTFILDRSAPMARQLNTYFWTAVTGAGRPCHTSLSESIECVVIWQTLPRHRCLDVRED